MIKCPYCQAEACQTIGTEIYPHRSDLAHLAFYICRACQAYVGCHKGTTNPLGRLANAELRKAKSLAHREFDPIWRDGGMSRSEAYLFLSQELGIPPKECHIGMFDLAQCAKVSQVVQSYYLG